MVNLGKIGSLKNCEKKTGVFWKIQCVTALNKLGQSQKPPQCIFLTSMSQLDNSAADPGCWYNYLSVSRPCL